MLTVDAKPNPLLLPDATSGNVRVDCLTAAIDESQVDIGAVNASIPR